MTPTPTPTPEQIEAEMATVRRIAITTPYSREFATAIATARLEGKAEITILLDAARQSAQWHESNWLKERDLKVAALAKVKRMDAALAETKAVIDFTAPALIEIVEGIAGTMDHGTWRDDHGKRLKDTGQWVAFYATAKSAWRAARAARKETT